jgi:hypothetical protein
MPVELSSIPCLANSVVVWSSAKLTFIFAKYKMITRNTSVKELNILKQCCNMLNISYGASSKKNLRPVLD